MRVCTKCHESKRNENFYKKRDKYHSWCKSCYRKYNNEYKAKFKGKGGNHIKYSRLTFAPEAGEMMFKMSQDGWDMVSIGIAFGAFKGEEFVPIHAKTVSDRISNYITRMMYRGEDVPVVGDIIPERRCLIAGINI